MPAIVPQACAVIFALLLVAAAFSDLRSRTIPNALPVALAAVFLPVAWSLGAEAALAHLAAAAAALAVAAGLFAVRAWGGGDAKLAAAAVLWLGVAPLPRFVLVMALAGGVLAVAVLLTQGRRARVPYGVAIAVAGLDWWAAAMGLVGRLS